MKIGNVCEDRLIRGGLAGIASGVIVLIFNLTTKAVGLTDTRWTDFGDVFAHGEPTEGVLCTVFSVFVVFIWEGA